MTIPQYAEKTWNPASEMSYPWQRDTRMFDRNGTRIDRAFSILTRFLHKRVRFVNYEGKPDTLVIYYDVWRRIPKWMGLRNERTMGQGSLFNKLCFKFGQWWLGPKSLTITESTCEDAVQLTGYNPCLPFKEEAYFPTRP